MNGRYYVGEWLVEPEQSRLVRGSESARLDPKSVQVLSFLAQHPNEVLTKEQIIDSVWDGAFVSDEVLTTAIWGLRKALGDDAKEPRYIQTIPRRGYRLIAPVERAAGEPSGRWEPSPYPGLSAFSQRDAQFFFGREAEVEALWGKLQERNLLGLIGPSGAGKTSLLRAGLIPAAPEGWEVVLCQPRSDAFDRLSAALEGRRSQNGKALWVVDQFEELFTLNNEETQARFAELLGRAAASGVHVLLSMRDDFLMRCHDYPELEAVFEKLTPVKALDGAALRRALIEPARASGYRFGDEALVAEILTEVRHEKGALPLLAFAASKLWEKRDREGRRLTREAYLSIGGVSGALAQHAEETLSSIGAEHEPIVREIFRNLTTASGTRVPIDREELLTVFSDRETAVTVLGKLVDARLLTSSEREVEVIHESLLSAWPRLVRWQAEDAAGAVLRDQLRQAARAWQERGRPEDLLWTGTSYRELALWRERYGGGLTATEEEFAQAARSVAGRRRRRRRMAVAALVTASIAVAAVTSSLWRRSRAEALRAEASKLLALGQVEIESNPTAALAYAIKSLELADTEEARLFALRSLQNAPPATTLSAPEDGLEAHQVAFSSNGEWLAVGGYRKAQLLNRDGRTPVKLPEVYPSAGFDGVTVGFDRSGDSLITNLVGDIRVWSVPEGVEAQRKDRFESGSSWLFMTGDGFFTATTASGNWILRWWPQDERESRLVGSTEAGSRARGNGQVDIDAAGRWLAYELGRGVYLRSLEDWSLPPRRFEHPAEVRGVAFHPDGESLAAGDASGEIRIWSVAGKSDEPVRVLDAHSARGLLRFSPKGRWLATTGRDDDGKRFVCLWDMTAPVHSKPVVLMIVGSALNDIAFDPAEEWLVTAEAGQMSLWPLGESYSPILEGHELLVQSIAFTPDGTRVLSASQDGTLRSWPLSPRGGEESRVLLRTRMTFPGLAVDPAGKQAVVSGAQGRVFLVPLAGGPARELGGFSERTEIAAVAFSPDGRSVAAAPFQGPAEEKVIRIWDLEGGDVRVLGPTPGAGDGFEGGIWKGITFDGDNTILAPSENGLLSFDLRDGVARVLSEGSIDGLAVSPMRRVAFGTNIDGDVLQVDLDENAPRTLAEYGPALDTALDPEETVLATGGVDGIVRVGPVSGGEPHLLFGHKRAIRSLMFSTDGRWLASAGYDRAIRLWPVPDVTKTPPHKRPHDQFLALLRSWTNLRAVPDARSSTGWKLEVGRFPGWAELPERWQ